METAPSHVRFINRIRFIETIFIRIRPQSEQLVVFAIIATRASPVAIYPRGNIGRHRLAESKNTS